MITAQVLLDFGEHLVEDGLGLHCDVDEHTATVPGVGAAPEVTIALEGVENSGHGGAGATV